MNFYQHFMGDYARDTKDLTPLEHGCYRLLMDHNYATEQPIPNEVTALYRIVGAVTPAERRAVEKVADRFFAINGDGRRHNKRVEKELTRAKEKSDKAKASAERRWGGIPVGDADGMRSHSDGNASHSHKPEETKTSPAPAGEGRDGVATLPDCPHERLIELYHQTLPTCTKVVEWNDTRKGLMRARWREQAVPNGKRPGYATVEDGLKFWRRFFVFVAESEFLTGKANPGPGKKPFVADLEWLIRPTNFAKVVEGKYS